MEWWPYSLTETLGFVTGAACETRRIERLSCTSPTADLAAAVVIPAHNAAATIARQLTALAGQRSAPMFELVVVANTCTDATAAISRGFVEGRPRWQVIEADAIASAGYARNRGVAATTAPLLLFCDADDRVGPGWVAAMVAALDHAEIVGGWLRPDAGNAPSWLRIAPGYPRQARIGLTEFDGRLWFPPTASFGCRRSAFEAAGGFFGGEARGGVDVEFVEQIGGGARGGVLDRDRTDGVHCPLLAFGGPGCVARRSPGRPYHHHLTRFAGRVVLERVQEPVGLG